MKNIFKRIAASLLIVVMCITLSACIGMKKDSSSGASPQGKYGDKLTGMAVTFEFSDSKAVLRLQEEDVVCNGTFEVNGNKVTVRLNDALSDSYSSSGTIEIVLQYDSKKDTLKYKSVSADNELIKNTYSALFVFCREFKKIN